MVRRVLRRILRSVWARRFACWLVARYMRLCHATGRWQVAGGETPNRLWDEGRPFILVCWHSRLLMTPLCWRSGPPIRVLISQHRDGTLIADTIAHFGLGTVRGSSRRPEKAQGKGGAQAFRDMVRLLHEGTCIGITPDGPRGPHMRASDGVVKLARLSGAPILPVAAATSRRVLLPSWDRFNVPLPFSRGAFVWGSAIAVSRDADAAELAVARLAVERALNEATAEADRLMGHRPLEPAPLPS